MSESEQAATKFRQLLHAAISMYDDKAFYGENLDRWMTWAVIELAHYGPEN